MIPKFVWHDSQTLDIERQKEIEDKITEDYDNLITDSYHPCHPGAVAVHLSISGPLSTDLVGNIRCNCGKPYVIINGTEDGSKINYKNAT